MLGCRDGELRIRALFLPLLPLRLVSLEAVSPKAGAQGKLRGILWCLRFSRQIGQDGQFLCADWRTPEGSAPQLGVIAWFRFVTAGSEHDQPRQTRAGRHREIKRRLFLAVKLIR